MFSQNGWKASANRREIGVTVPWIVHGVEFVGGVREGAVTTVLGYVATQFHQRVEPLEHPGCWGWAYRDVIGGTSISNHASGTAIDINAPRHPVGVQWTFSPGKVAAIHDILRECDGVVRWGGDYTGRKDDMHFEINADIVDVTNVAMKLLEIEEVEPVSNTFYVKGNIKPDIFCCTFTGDAMSKRHVGPAEWAIVTKTGVNAVTVDQKYIDEIPVGTTDV